MAALAVMAMWVTTRPAPLHEDEAIYAAWARTIANGTDPWLTTTPVDKPPLYLYALAGVFRLFGESPVTARGLNVAVMIGVALMLARLSRRPAVSVVLFASTPLVPFMAGSAFTDPLMVLCILGGWLAGRAARPGWAGLACGLAAAVKPTAVLLWPVVVASVLRQEHLAGRWRHFVVGAAAPLALVWAWDASRMAPSWWLLGWRAYGTLGRTPSAWSAWWPPLLLSLGASWIALGWHTPPPKNVAELNVVRSLFAVWVPLHIGLGFQPWDRYLFPLAVLIAWAAGETAPSHRLMATLATNALLLALLLSVPHPLLAGRDGRWEGIAQMATLLGHTSGPIYHRELGRPLAFYAPSVSKRLVWLPPGTSPSSGQTYGRVRHIFATSSACRALLRLPHSGPGPLMATRPP
ncbi:MAG: hypothetical protein Q9O62_09300 [Ardenticatenia bacterium]|nr:hypothetical protein [Ardenticatenia bacterium]